MSSPNASNDAAPQYRKSRPDLYTVLLVLALLALLLGILCLHLDMKTYEYNFRGAPTVMAPPSGNLQFAIYSSQSAIPAAPQHAQWSCVS